MTAKTVMRVEMDDSMRERPDLLRAAEVASDFLDEFVGQYADTFGEDRVMTWRYDPRHPDGERVWVSYSEHDGLGERAVQQWFPPKDLFDSVSRRSRMRDLLHGVLAQWWKQSDARTAAYFRALDEAGE